MQRKDLKVGRYYLVNVKREVDYVVNGKMIGKLLDIVDDSPFNFKKHKQIYFFEFIKEDVELHGGQGIRDGRNYHCWFMTRLSIIKEVPEAEVLAHEL